MSLKPFNFYLKFFLILSKKGEMLKMINSILRKGKYIKVSILELRKLLKKRLKSQKVVKGKYKYF